MDITCVYIYIFFLQNFVTPWPPKFFFKGEVLHIWALYKCIV